MKSDTMMGLEELERKVNHYLERINRYDPAAKIYQNEEFGYWHIISGLMVDGKRIVLEDVVHGRFIDAVATAVQQPAFYSLWGDSDNPNNAVHGRVEKISVSQCFYPTLH
jgi:hypothetical protein